MYSGSRIIITIGEPTHAARRRHVLHPAAQHTLLRRLAVATAVAKDTRGLPCPTLTAGALLCSRSATGLTEQQLAAPNTKYGTFTIFRHISAHFGVTAGTRRYRSLPMKGV